MKKTNKLTIDEQKVLQFIIIGRNSLEKLQETFKEEEKLSRIIISLEKKGMIKISFREGKIYGLMETTKGYELIKGKGFEDWNISEK